MAETLGICGGRQVNLSSREYASSSVANALITFAVAGATPPISSATRFALLTNDASLSFATSLHAVSMLIVPIMPFLQKLVNRIVRVFRSAKRLVAIASEVVC
jgi:hypothetical protein